MPGFDRTGPWGAGSMTGGRRGLCASMSTGANWFGRGRGSRRGMGPDRGGRGYGFGMSRGFGRSAGPPDYYDMPYSSASPMNRDQEINFLQNQAQAMKEELEDIEARISEIQQKESS